MRLFQHELLVVLDHLNEGLPAAQPLLEQVARVLGEALLDPHVVVQQRRDHVPPPMVAKLVSIEPLVLEVALLEHGQRIGDVGRMLHRALRGDDVANPLPGMRSPPILHGIDADTEIDEAVLHLLQVARLGRQANGHLAIHAHMGGVPILIVRHGNGAEVRGNGLRHVIDAADRVAPEAVDLHEVPLAVEALPPRAGDAIGVGRALAELIEARIPRLPVVGRDGGQANAQAVDVVARQGHATPVGILAGLALIMESDDLGTGRLPSPIRCLHEDAVADLVEAPRRTVYGHGVHQELAMQVKPKIGGASLQRLEGDVGRTRHLKGRRGGDIELQPVVLHIEGVAARQRARHVEVLVGRSGTGRPTGLERLVGVPTSMVGQVTRKGPTQNGPVSLRENGPVHGCHQQQCEEETGHGSKIRAAPAQLSLSGR